MTSRLLEARIRKLCGEALKAEQRDLEAVFQELRMALHEHNALLRKLVAEKLSPSLWPIADSPSPKPNGD